MARNPWGYTTTDTLPSLMTASELATITGGTLSSATERIEAMLAATSSVIRDWCGWHIAPVMTCEWTGPVNGRVMELPVMNVQDIVSVSLGGAVLSDSDYDVDPSGLIRLKTGYRGDGWANDASVVFTAGVDTASIAGIVSQVATNALVAAPGVQHEQAGDVSITYNRTGNGITGGIRLLDSDKIALSAYRIPRA